jgi:hypothetical protein
MTRLLSIFLLAMPLFCSAAGPDNVVLLGQKDDIAFDEIKAGHMARTLDALLRVCTVATKVESIPPVAYKGLRVKRAGKLIEAHIFPNSRESYMVKIYTTENGTVTLHGKYGDHDYPLISMLEMKPLK